MIKAEPSPSHIMATSQSNREHCFLSSARPELRHRLGERIASPNRKRRRREANENPPSEGGGCAAGEDDAKLISVQSLVKRIYDRDSEIHHVAHVARDKHHAMPKGRGGNLSIHKWLGVSNAKRISHQLAPRH